MPGLASEPSSMPGRLEKYGIGVQVTRVGKYKSYVEPFTRTDMSPENREQLQKLLDDVWGSLMADIAKSRGRDPGSDPGDGRRGGHHPGLDAAKDAHLVDKVAYRDEIIDQLKKETGRHRTTKDPFKQVAARPTTRRRTVHAAPARSATGKVAVVYAEGDIVEGEGDQTEVGGVKFARELRRPARGLRGQGHRPSGEQPRRQRHRLRDDPAGGPPRPQGEARHRLDGLLRRLGRLLDLHLRRPDLRRADDDHGLHRGLRHQFDIQKLANDHGITFDSVKTGKFADAASRSSRPQDDEELAVFQKMVDWIYGQFIAKVAEGRKLTPSRRRGDRPGPRLVRHRGPEARPRRRDRRPRCRDQYAGTQAGLGEHPRVDRVPAVENLLGGDRRDAGQLSRPTGLHAAADRPRGPDRRASCRRELAWLRSFNDPKGVYARLPVDLC